MATMRDIKRRRDSIQSTEQITKAMKLVATVKLQKSRVRAEAAKPYFNLMYDTMNSIISRSGAVRHKYLQAGASPKKAVITITSNRGLAGGYNNNIVKLVNAELPAGDTLVYAIGRKGRDGLARRGFKIQGDYSEVINDPLYQDAAELTGVLLEAFARGEIGEIYLAFTMFKNTVVHTPRLLKLLPVELPERGTADGQEPKARAVMDYEPDDETVLDAIVPKYMSSLIYGALLESLASENGARMTAMDSATSNAEEMIEDLSLQYNRARQGAITQELTEIVAGANAIGN